MDVPVIILIRIRRESESCRQIPPSVRRRGRRNWLRQTCVRHCPEGEDALDDGEDSPCAAGDADEQYSEDSRADLVDVKIMEAY